MKANLRGLATTPPLGVVALLVTTLLLYVPGFFRVVMSATSVEQVAHIPIVLLMSLWLLLQRLRGSVLAPAARFEIAWALLLVSLAAYVIGASQRIAMLEIGSLIPTLIACVLLGFGIDGVRRAALPLALMFFMIPWPDAVINTLTLPMKLAVSHVTAGLLYHAGLPIAVDGVVITVGQYQLLVADACSGLQTLFALESLGFFYLTMVKSASAVRNMVLAILIVPIAFSANVCRVIALTLITYYLGDDVGQGFLHNFSGMLMFFCALVLILGADLFLEKRIARARP